MAYKESGVGVHFAHLRPAHLTLFELVGITDLVSLLSCLFPCGELSDLSVKVGHTHFHPNLRTAMHEIESLGFGTTTTTQFPV